MASQGGTLYARSKTESLGDDLANRFFEQPILNSPYDEPRLHHALDAKGHDWLLDRFKVLQKGRAGASSALGDLLEVLTAGAITKADVIAAPVAVFPLSPCMKACWDAWELAQYGPAGRSAEAGPANPQTRRPTRWRRLFGRR